MLCNTHFSLFITRGFFYVPLSIQSFSEQTIVLMVNPLVGQFQKVATRLFPMDFQLIKKSIKKQIRCEVIFRFSFNNKPFCDLLCFILHLLLQLNLAISSIFRLQFWTKYHCGSSLFKRKIYFIEREFVNIIRLSANVLPFI